MASVTLSVFRRFPHSNPMDWDYAFDTDEQMVDAAKELGATHVLLPGYMVGSFLKKSEFGFLAISRWGRSSDGRLWMNREDEHLVFPLEVEDMLVEL